jgi:hypothetical protein
MWHMSIWGILHYELQRTQDVEVITRRVYKQVARMEKPEQKAAVQELITAMAKIAQPLPTVIIMREVVKE